jgi:hypothetical protein
MRPTVIVLAVLAGLGGRAVAKPKVAVVAVEGDKHSEAREIIIESIDDDVAILSSKQVNRTVDDLGFDLTTLDEKQAHKLGKELEADAVIEAKISPKGRDKVLRFHLWVHGKKVKGFKVEFGSLKSARFKQQLHDKLLDKLGYAAGDDDAAAPPPTKTKGKTKPEGDDDSSPPPSKTKKVPVGDDDDDAKLIKGRPRSKPSGDDDDAAVVGKTDDSAAPHRVAHAGDDDDDSSVSAKVEVKPGGGSSGDRTVNRDAIRIDVGPSVSQRVLSFNSRVFDQMPNGYKNTIVPGARVDGELYPLAFGNPNGIAAGLGIGGVFDRTVALSVTSTIQPMTKFPVTQQRYSIGPRFRILFGHAATSPSLTLGVGYGDREFVVNRSQLLPGNTLDIPDVRYRGYDPTLEFRLPLTARLALSFGAGAILLTSAGAIENQGEYGQATVTGVEGDLSFDVLFTPHLGLKLAFDFAQLGFKFKGNGVMTNDRDGDPSTQDVGGAADRYIGGAAMFAVYY